MRKKVGLMQGRMTLEVEKLRDIITRPFIHLGDYMHLMLQVAPETHTGQRGLMKAQKS